MKKGFSLIVLLILACTAFGQIQLSAGGGASYSPIWMVSKATADEPYAGETVTSTVSVNTLSITGFVDATYVEAYLGMLLTLGDVKASTKFSEGLPGTDSETTDPYSGSWLVIGALGKYPFKVGDFTIFPLVGFEYDLNLTYKYDGEDVKETLTDDQLDNLNQLWVKAGVAADFSIAGSLFIRPQVLFGLKFLSQYEKDGIEAFESTPGVADASQTDMRLDVGISVGYKF
jgi:hypothetical protein